MAIIDIERRTSGPVFGRTAPRTRVWRIFAVCPSINGEGLGSGSPRTAPQAYEFTRIVDEYAVVTATGPGEALVAYLKSRPDLLEQQTKWSWGEHAIVGFRCWLVTNFENGEDVKGYGNVHTSEIDGTPIRWVWGVSK